MGVPPFCSVMGPHIGNVAKGIWFNLLLDYIIISFVGFAPKPNVGIPPNGASHPLVGKERDGATPTNEMIT